MSLIGMGGKRFKVTETGLLHGGDGPKEAGKPTIYDTYHPASSLPFWDWIELEDGTYHWLGRGRHGGYGANKKA